MRSKGRIWANKIRARPNIKRLFDVGLEPYVITMLYCFLKKTTKHISVYTVFVSIRPKTERSFVYLHSLTPLLCNKDSTKDDDLLYHILYMYYCFYHTLYVYEEYIQAKIRKAGYRIIQHAVLSGF